MRNYNKYIVNIDNLACNVSLIKRLLNENTKLCAVVKADAYGVGVKTVVKILDRYVDFYAVSSVIEAKEIRDLGSLTNILILGETPIENIDYCAKNNISISVGNIDYLNAINKILHSSVNIHLKINTGLNRYGFKNKKEFEKAVKFVENNKLLKLEGIFTHFATKNNDLKFIDVQKTIFDEYCSICPKGIIKHCANSFATIFSSSLHYNMVRVGLNLYGDLRKEFLPLKDVVEIKSEIVALNIVQKSQSIGYDRTYIADKTRRIAVVPLGYADGINRYASNNFYVLVNGKRANIVGNVCMDSFMIDVTGIDNVYIGSEVILIGISKEEKIEFNDWAMRLKTSPYDILLNFKYRRMQYVEKRNKEN